jgi:hypothetical protein
MHSVRVTTDAESGFNKCAYRNWWPLPEARLLHSYPVIAACYGRSMRTFSPDVNPPETSREY